MKRVAQGGQLFGRVSSEQASRYFFNAGLLNIVVAVVVTLPVLVPQLGLPLKLEVWPGTWMFIAYFVFLITGVVGSFVWCFIYYMMPRLYGKDTVSDFLALTQLVSFETAVYGISAFMGIEAGYYGGSLYHDGFGLVVITQIISWIVIPVGTLIVVALLSTVTGVLNLMTSGEGLVASPVVGSKKRLLVLFLVGASIAIAVAIEIVLVVGKY